MTNKQKILKVPRYLFIRHNRHVLPGTGDDIVEVAGFSTLTNQMSTDFTEGFHQETIINKYGAKQPVNRTDRDKQVQSLVCNWQIVHSGGTGTGQGYYDRKYHVFYLLTCAHNVMRPNLVSGTFDPYDNIWVYQ